MMRQPPISKTTWRRLIEDNEAAVRAGWAAPGVFATGIGPEYQRGSLGSLLYVGKSAGPCGKDVGSYHDQVARGLVSTKWMIATRNRSAFWQFVDMIVPTRRRIAWTNVCKMDRIGGQKPPTDAKWSDVADSCRSALTDGIESLAPHVIRLPTSGAYQVGGLCD